MRAGTRRGGGERGVDGRVAPAVEGTAGALPGFVGGGQVVRRAGEAERGGEVRAAGQPFIEWDRAITAARERSLEWLMFFATGNGYEVGEIVVLGRGSLRKGGGLGGRSLVSGGAPKGRSRAGEDAVGLAEKGEDRHDLMRNGAATCKMLGCHSKECDQRRSVERRERGGEAWRRRTVRLSTEPIVWRGGIGVALRS